MGKKYAYFLPIGEKSMHFHSFFIQFQSFFSPNLLFGHIFAPSQGGGVKQKNIHPCKCREAKPKHKGMKEKRKQEGHKRHIKRGSIHSMKTKGCTVQSKILQRWQVLYYYIITERDLEQIVSKYCDMMLLCKIDVQKKWYFNRSAPLRGGGPTPVR